MNAYSRFTGIVFLLSITCAFAQTNQPNSFGKGSTLRHQDRIALRGGGDFFNPDWAPFYHGVASGDPQSDKVIIWTRVTPEDMNEAEVSVDWRMATDPDLVNIVASGSIVTNADRDYTVKVDVTGLTPGTTYYYGFIAYDKASLTGKTKTTPAGEGVDHLRFGVVSCSNYQAGYFNAYARLAERTDLDAVIHLGDYIYEYADQVYGSDSIWADRALEPMTEIVDLEDYRTRYSTYRLDTNLIRAHQQHAFIAVWDDHESANDSYVDGAENHDNASEGSWEDRKANAKKAYFEWMPIRDNAEESIYRTVKYGDLMDLILLDTRLEGRDSQINDVTEAELYATDRTILGAEQKAWFLNELSSSDAKWKIVGQQVIFAELNVGWAGAAVGSSYEALESLFLDIWDGYPAERAEIVGYIESQSIDNVVLLTGDFHSTFAFDVALPAVDVRVQEVPGAGTVPIFQENEGYDPATGAGSKAVEFATPSITSANFDENTSQDIALSLQFQMNKDIIVPVGSASFNLGNPNPHMKYVDLIQHGYFLLDVKPDSVQANWYFGPILEISEEENFNGAYYTKDTENHLQAAAAESEPKAIQDTPAPNNPPLVTTPTRDPATGTELLILSSFPNPVKSTNNLHYALNQGGMVTINLFDSNGTLVKNLLRERLPEGIYSLESDLSTMAAGVYFYHIELNGKQQVVRVIKQ